MIFSQATESVSFDRIYLIVVASSGHFYQTLKYRCRQQNYTYILFRVFSDISCNPNETYHTRITTAAGFYLSIFLRIDHNISSTYHV